MLVERVKKYTTEVSVTVEYVKKTRKKLDMLLNGNKQDM